VNRRRRTTGSSDRGKELALIHIAAADLGLRTNVDDSAYRDMLWTVARVRSAKDLDAAGRQTVLRHLRACGWQQQPTASTYERGSPAALIRHLWTQLHKAGAIRQQSDRALRHYIAKHLPAATGVTEVAPQHLSTADSMRIIEQLKRWLARAETSREP
jgi:phage gp16-like protein